MSHCCVMPSLKSTSQTYLIFVEIQSANILIVKCMYIFIDFFKIKLFHYIH